MNELRLTDPEPGLWARVPRQRRSCTRYWRLPGSRANLVVRWIAKELARFGPTTPTRASGDTSGAASRPRVVQEGENPPAAQFPLSADALPGRDRGGS